jgi:dTDP-4-dehydrorhamnose 3,5-epimerase
MPVSERFPNARRDGRRVTTDATRQATHAPYTWSTDLHQHFDERGEFVELFHANRFRDATGRDLTVRQANVSISRRGVIRGVHYFPNPDGPNKYVTCVHGAAIDVAVDLRVGSPTFGEWKATHMSQSAPAAVFLPSGIGHAFVALTDRAVMTYLCDKEYVPGAEGTVDPLDPDLALPWPRDLATIISDRDRGAPSLREALERELLPRFP